MKLKKQLRPLCNQKYTILLKDPANGYNETDVIFMNENWNPPQRFYRIPTNVHKITKTERIETQEVVVNDRKFIIEACIVRIMKARLTLRHNELIIEVSSQLMTRFQPNVKLIKER